MTTQLLDGHGLGALPSHDPRELRYAAPRVSAEIIPTLPARLSLAQWRSPIEDQGAEGSCTGQSGSTAAEMLARIMGQNVALSRRDGYYWARKLWNGRIDVDQGAPLNTAADGVLGGLCREETWRYVAGQYAQQPPAQEGVERPQNRFLASHRTLFPNNPDKVLAVKTALFERQPVVFGFAVYGDFYRTPQSGIMPVTMGGGFLGGHAVVAIGYQDNASYSGGGYFLIDNSWGSWTRNAPDPDAVAGSFLMPYACIQNGICFEARAYIGKAAPPPEPPPPPDSDRVSKARVLAEVDAMRANVSILSG
jgi:hypothetical protein